MARRIQWNTWNRIPNLYKYIGFFVLGAVIFGVLGWYIPSPLTAHVYEGAVLRQASGNFTYIHPLLTCDIASQEVFTDLYPLKDTLNGIINKNKAAGKVSSVSVYFRDSRAAHWFSINDNETYAPASLLKVFVMMAYYKEAETLNDPSILERRYVLHASNDPIKEFPGEAIPHLVDGQSYSVEQLIQQMIIYSDNDALDTLVENMDDDTFEKQKLIFSDLHIASPIDRKAEIQDYMRVSDYATIFRVLFGATYLGTEYSEKALQLLSQAHYKDALAAGLPSGITVAHKFGISPGANGTDPQLHDCGVVYYPQHPYLLCIMTRGTNYDDLKSTIKDISAATYAAVQKKYPQ